MGALGIVRVGRTEVKNCTTESACPMHCLQFSPSLSIPFSLSLLRFSQSAASSFVWGCTRFSVPGGSLVQGCNLFCTSLSVVRHVSPFPTPERPLRLQGAWIIWLKNWFFQFVGMLPPSHVLSCSWPGAGTRTWIRTRIQVRNRVGGCTVCNRWLKNDF